MKEKRPNPDNIDDLDDVATTAKRVVDQATGEDQTWPEGVLKPVGREAFTFFNIYMAHYRGWTILVALDAVDRDWGAQATPGLYCRGRDYAEANRTGPDDMPLLAGFHSTKEEALAAAEVQIDAFLG